MPSSAYPHSAGIRVSVTADGHTRIKEVQLGGNYLSQNAAEVHFGLADTTQVEQIKIQTPKPQGKTVVKKDVKAGQWLELILDE